MARSAKRAFNTGDRVGRYELIEEIGVGGFAAVWRARVAGPGGFESKVAIKIMHSERAQDPDFQKMFIDEAKVAALIDHPNVVKIFDLGFEGETLYMAMEYVRGLPLSSLRVRMQRDGAEIPPEIVLRILADTCAGLHAAHELERDGKKLHVIHRDISPENILVSDQGVVKLIDFGIAKAADRLATDTASGLAKGKIRYMAPEQALAHHVDRRADIWALGAVAYDLLEGQPVFDGPNDIARVHALVGSQPAPPITRAVPPGTAELVAIALQRDVDKRWSTAAQMRSAIEATLAKGSAVTTETVAKFFAPWLDAREVEERESENNLLRRRLAGPAAGGATDTGIGPPPRSVRGGIPQDRPAAASERIETLSALQSAPLRASRSRAMTVAAASFFSFSVLFFGWITLRSRAATPSAPPSTSVAATATAPQTLAAPASASLPEPPSNAGVDVSLDDAGASAQTGNSGEAPARAKTGKPRPNTGPARPKGPRPPRPKYDDTIQ